jgi:hypothetical protein
MFRSISTLCLRDGHVYFDYIFVCFSQFNLSYSGFCSVFSVALLMCMSDHVYVC